jgi:hypothetical protein
MALGLSLIAMQPAVAEEAANVAYDEPAGGAEVAALQTALTTSEVVTLDEANEPGDTPVIDPQSWDAQPTAGVGSCDCQSGACQSCQSGCCPHCGRPRCRHGHGGINDPNKRWAVTASQTADYVTNLALPFALTPNNAAVLRNDAQFQTLANVQYRLLGDLKNNLSTSYNYYQSVHPVIRQLDLASHTVVSRYTRTWTEKSKGAIEHEYSFFYLQGASFVSRNRVGARWLTSPSTRGDWQFSYDLSRNEFRIDPSLTSWANSAKLEYIYYLGNNRNNFLTSGYAFGRNDANLSSWSYNVNNIFMSGRWLYGPQNRNELILLGSYGNYQFDGNDVIQTTTRRHDDIYTISGKLGRKLNNHWQTFGQYTYYNANSNVIRQNYYSSLFSIGVLAGW